MKNKILSQISSMFMSSFFVAIGIHNYKKDPTDNLSLACAIFFTLLIGFNLGTMLTLFTQRKEQEARKKKLRY